MTIEDLVSIGLIVVGTISFGAMFILLARKALASPSPKIDGESIGKTGEPTVPKSR